ncbi:MAG: DUF2637 domain-containing protein [Mycobacterium sp.]
MTTQTEITQRNHHRAVRFFWALLIGATTVSLIGNVAHAVLPYLPRIVVQIGAAAVPPIALLAAVHGIALAVRAGASGTVYRWAVSAVAAIGVGAFAVSFLALRDLMRGIGYSSTTAWIFPTIIDTAVAVSTLMLVALGDKPARRTRAVTTCANTHPSLMQRLARTPSQGGNSKVKPSAPSDKLARTVQATGTQTSASVQRSPAQTGQDSPQTSDVDADLASALIATRATTQPIQTVMAVLAASREGLSMNAAAKASGINYRTARRIVENAGNARFRWPADPCQPTISRWDFPRG